VSVIAAVSHPSGLGIQPVAYYMGVPLFKSTALCHLLTKSHTIDPRQQAGYQGMLCVLLF